jgi:hypothetical protein
VRRKKQKQKEKHRRIRKKERTFGKASNNMKEERER